jgi:hypothetical protein
MRNLQKTLLLIIFVFSMAATISLIGSAALVENYKMLAQSCRLLIKKIQFYAINCYNPAHSQKIHKGVS